LGIIGAAMSRREFNVRVPGPISGRGDVVAAIDKLVERVTRLARNVERVVPAAGTKPTTSLKTEEQLELAFGTTLGTPACSAVTVDIEDARNFPLSPKQDGATSNAGPSGSVGKLSAKAETKSSKPNNANGRAENGVACHVLALHDRLGGFMKLPIDPQREQNS
jgi:hypothetical protein